MIALPFQCAYKAQKCYLAGQLCNLEAKYASIIVSHLHGLDRDVVIESTCPSKRAGLWLLSGSTDHCVVTSDTNTADVKITFSRPMYWAQCVHLKVVFLHFGSQPDWTFRCSLNFWTHFAADPTKTPYCNQCHTVNPSDMITVEAVVTGVWVWRSVLSVLSPFSELIWKSLEHCVIWLVASSD